MQGIEKEYQELDTVWFMAGSLFRNYPYDIPTEAFSLQLFTQAFATVQASIVHLQDVTLSKRFALVPLGPPLLSYSSTSKVPGLIQLSVFFGCLIYARSSGGDPSKECVNGGFYTSEKGSSVHYQYTLLYTPRHA